MIKNKAELYKAADAIFWEIIELGFPLPFDIFQICAKLPDYGIKTAPLTTQGLRGCAVITPGLNAIVVSSNLNVLEQNFHGFHEFAHCKLHSDLSPTFKCYDNGTAAQDSFVEWQANEAAVEIMSPCDRFIPEFLKMYRLAEHPKSWRQFYGSMDIWQALAAKYHYTPTVARLHIESLAYEIDQYAAGDRNIEFLSRNELMFRQIVPTDYNKGVAERKTALMKLIYKRA